MLVVPGPTIETMPVLFTVATLVFAELHVPAVTALRVLSDIVAVAVNCSVAPTKSIVLAEVTEIDTTVTAGGSGVVDPLHAGSMTRTARRMQTENTLLILWLPSEFRHVMAVAMKISSTSARDHSIASGSDMGGDIAPSHLCPKTGSSALVY